MDQGFAETGSARVAFDDPGSNRVRSWILRSSIELLHGPGETPREAGDPVVVCLVQDGQPYVETFVEHYSSLGAGHIVFLDNGSTDDTVNLARGYENVTVLRSKLPFKRYKISMKRYLIEHFGKDRWSLYADVDELFDYPYSDVVGLGSLLEYLDSKSYTAVVAQMLDMFPDRLLSGDAGGEESFRDDHRFYDISDVTRLGYGEHAGGTGNAVDNEEVEVIRGGIQRTVFGHHPTLTKHPLVFFDGELEPMDGSSHWISNARIADFTGVLLHYKYLNHFREHALQAAQKENYANSSAKYKKYLKVMEQNPGLRLRQGTSKELESVNDLVGEQFLAISQDYMVWVDREEEKAIRERGIKERPRRLVEAFSAARKQVEARKREIRRLEERVPALRKELERGRRETSSLEERNRKLETGVRNLRLRLERIRRIRGRISKMFGSGK